MKFEIYQDSNQQWRWHLKTGTGEMIAVSSIGYEARYKCEQAIFFVQGSSRATIAEI